MYLWILVNKRCKADVLALFYTVGENISFSPSKYQFNYRFSRDTVSEAEANYANWFSMLNVHFISGMKHFFGRVSYHFIFCRSKFPIFLKDILKLCSWSILVYSFLFLNFIFLIFNIHIMLPLYIELEIVFFFMFLKDLCRNELAFFLLLAISLWEGTGACFQSCRTEPFCMPSVSSSPLRLHYWSLHSAISIVPLIYTWADSLCFINLVLSTSFSC